MLYITYVCPNEGMKLGDDDGNFLSVATRLWLANFIITLFFVCNICIISPQITPLFVSLRNFSFGKAGRLAVAFHSPPCSSKFPVNFSTLIFTLQLCIFTEVMLLLLCSESIIAFVATKHGINIGK